MKRTYSRLSSACAALLLVSASAHAVTYQAENFSNAYDTTAGRIAHEVRRFGVRVVTVEPGVYLPGHGGVRIEDTLIVTDDEPELLTLTSKELLVL